MVYTLRVLVREALSPKAAERIDHMVLNDLRVPQIPQVLQDVLMFWEQWLPAWVEVSGVPMYPVRLERWLMKSPAIPLVLEKHSRSLTSRGQGLKEMADHLVCRSRASRCTDSMTVL